MILWRERLLERLKRGEIKSSNRRSLRLPFVAPKDTLMTAATLLSAIATAVTGFVVYQQTQIAAEALTRADRNRTFSEFVKSTRDLCGENLEIDIQPPLSRSIHEEMKLTFETWKNTKTSDAVKAKSKIVMDNFEEYRMWENREDIVDSLFEFDRSISLLFSKDEYKHSYARGSFSRAYMYTILFCGIGIQDAVLWYSKDSIYSDSMLVNFNGLLMGANSDGEGDWLVEFNSK